MTRGSENVQQCGPLCSRHQRRKTYGLFDLKPDTDDDPHTVHWHTPAGITGAVQGEPALPGC